MNQVVCKLYFLIQCTPSKNHNHKIPGKKLKKEIVVNALKVIDKALTLLPVLLASFTFKFGLQ